MLKPVQHTALKREKSSEITHLFTTKAQKCEESEKSF